MRRRRITQHQAISEPTPNLSWDVLEQPVFSGGQQAVNFKALHRNDNNNLLSIVKKGYFPITNDKLKEVTHKLAEFTGFKIEGYASYQGGAKVLAYLKNQENYNIAGFEADNYMVIGNSFDKSTGFFIGQSSIILRCTNAFGSLEKRKSIRHSRNAIFEMGELVRFYQQFVHQEEAARTKFERWHNIQIPDELKELFVDSVLEIDPAEKSSTRKINQKKDLAASVNREMAAMGNTMFGLFNGLTHYTTHVLNTKEKVKGNMLGQPAILNARGIKVADRLLLEMV